MQLNQEEKGRKTYAITMFQYYTIEQEDVNILMEAIINKGILKGKNST
jgi:hypothetical protein